MTQSGFAPEELNFEEAYQGETPLGERMPWDIGRPQPALIRVADADGFGGEVLDIGCGLGNNSIFLASRGYHVTGVDGAPTALAEARKRAAAQGAEIDFQQGDATRLDGLVDRFDSVLDSALYHCLTEEQRHEYIAALHRATRPGARLHIFCFSDKIPEGFPGPFRISEQNLRDTVGPKWTITAIEEERYDTSVTAQQFAAVGRQMDPNAEIDPAAFDVFTESEQGTAQVPVWHLSATRA
ncbi:class I SAM-dependent methyltransferase [Actinocrispum wychmicini]|uniref:Methyltransferase family protein n=1 Tax=Actinocrispum wychmicini TaxID=1213861 RepID=A0A4R2K2H5_9PSEU|nr:class I SAM-dependent methyltransferase [Actinocrispum wychmicini]TCO65917.1 methyltransferase family protein [Actinocrispum wychmicini]